MREIKYLVVHCTAGHQNETIADLKAWFKKMGWKNPGYHYVIEANGNIVQLLDESLIANGVAGYNANSIHVSYLGGIDKSLKAVDNRTTEQKCALRHILGELRTRYQKAKIKGHRDFSPDKNGNGKIDYFEYIKQCPCFDAITEYKDI